MQLCTAAVAVCLVVGCLISVVNIAPITPPSRISLSSQAILSKLPEMARLCSPGFAAGPLRCRFLQGGAGSCRVAALRCQTAVGSRVSLGASDRWAVGAVEL